MFEALMFAVALTLVWHGVRIFGWATAILGALAIPAVAGGWLCFVFDETRNLGMFLFAVALVLASGAVACVRQPPVVNPRRRLTNPRW